MKAENLEKTVELRHELHRQPDLPLKESGTIRILQRFLRENTSLEIVDCDSWFYAVKPGRAPRAPKIAFRADMDALPIDETGMCASSSQADGKPAEADRPVWFYHASEKPGISHKCGHDGHSAALCGLALELEGREIDRTVYFIFQKGEEVGGGGAACSELLREEGIKEVYAFHNRDGFPEGAVVYRRGLTQPASEGLDIRFTGKKAHASAPETGRNPAGAVARTALVAERLNRSDGMREGAVEIGEAAELRGAEEPSEAETEEPVNPAIAHQPLAFCTIVGMTAGSGDFGIAAGEGSLQVTLRAEREADMLEMERQILACAKEQAEKGGLEMSFSRKDVFPETRNTEAGVERVLRAAASLKMPIVESKEIWRPSEDFGYYLKVSEGAMFYVGSGEKWPALHTIEYDFNDRILGTAVDMFEELVVR